MDNKSFWSLKIIACLWKRWKINELYIQIGPKPSQIFRCYELCHVAQLCQEILVSTHKHNEICISVMTLKHLESSIYNYWQMWINKTYFLCILVDSVWIHRQFTESQLFLLREIGWFLSVGIRIMPKWHLQGMIFAYHPKSNQLFSEWPRGMLNLQIVDEIFVAEPLVQPEWAFVTSVQDENKATALDCKGNVQDQVSGICQIATFYTVAWRQVFLPLWFVSPDWWYFSNHSIVLPLTHWGGDKMTDFFQTTFSNAFLEWKCVNFD